MTKEDVLKEEVKKIPLSRNFRTMIDKRTGIISNPNKTVVSVPASGFPFMLWQEWNKDCVENYKSIRWLKMWTDHQKALKLDEMITQSQMMGNDEEEKKAVKEYDVVVIGGNHVDSRKNDGEV